MQHSTVDSKTKRKYRNPNNHSTYSPAMLKLCWLVRFGAATLLDEFVSAPECACHCLVFSVRVCTNC